MSTRDNDAARTEDQDGAEHQGMSPRGGKGPTAAATAPVEGAFGKEKGQTELSGTTSDSLSEGPLVFDDTPDPR